MAALAALAGNSGREPGECWHEGQTRVARLRDAFDQGRLSLADRARSEQLFLGLCHALRARLDPGRRGQRELADELNERLADRYLCNFSVFQSLPDVWAIDQVFPIVPLHRLDEMPERRAVIHDLTCDSDGRIDSYVDALGVESSLPLHAPRPGEDYLLGIFLVGAYQEILGDIHNLFGDTDSVNVELAADGYRISEPRAGEDAASVLRHVHFDSEELIAGYARRLEESDLNLADRGELMAELRRGLAGYTYPEK
jgi:arginine decarboxylase